MEVIFDYRNFVSAKRGAAAAIGNFDGVHLGHRAVIDLARTAGAAGGHPLGIVTFEPHPRSFFAPDAAPFRLMNAEAKAHRLEKLGVEVLYQLPFDASLAGMSAEGFVRDVLADGLGLGHVVVGADFRFGRGRAGDAAILQEICKTAGIGVTVAPLVADAKGEFSSTAIRRALTEGRPEDAARMLGHWHRIEGRVIKGHQRGRDLGFPTANISIAGLHPPRFGVYATEVDVLGGPHRGRYIGAASIGERPTFGVNAANLEVFLLDFAGDLYGADISVALVAWLRGEEKFDDLNALIAQMGRDVAEVRARMAKA